MASNSSSATVGGINIDKTAPITTSALQPAVPDGKRGWYVSDVTVSLDAHDPLLTSGEEGSGIQYKEYRVNDGDWQRYGGPFVVRTESLDDKVEYRSVDNADNIEATKEVHFHLDKTPPDTGIGAGALDGVAWDPAHLQHGVLTNSATLGLTGTATDNLCLWEVRAVDPDSGTTLASQQPAGASVFPAPPNALAYSLNVPLHTGINTIDVTAEDCAGWTKTTRIQVVYVVPVRFDPRVYGGWMMSVQNGTYTKAQMQTFFNYVNVVSDIWGNDAARNRYGALTLPNYQAFFHPPSRPTLDQALEPQLLANWLNLVSGRIGVKQAVTLSRERGWQAVVDNTGGSTKTFALNVTVDVEDKVQPVPPSAAIGGPAKDLMEHINNELMIVY